VSIERLIEIAGSTRLPDRLRARVAAAAFARALVLDRADAALHVAPMLRVLSPRLAPGIDRYVRAATATDRRRAGVLMLLRSPQLSATVGGLDFRSDGAVLEPLQFEPFGRNWWCGISEQRMSPTMELLYGSGDVPYPRFVAAAERAVVEDELLNLARQGTAREYMMREAIAWAQQAPATDVDAAEALAKSISGWRRSRCESIAAPDLPPRAFALLHRRFPNTEWARRSRYWYR
jgi:hypothetical protein